MEKMGFRQMVETAYTCNWIKRKLLNRWKYLRLSFG